MLFKKERAPASGIREKTAEIAALKQLTASATGVQSSRGTYYLMCY